MINFYYNNQQPFSGQTLPYVAMEETPVRFGTRLGYAQTITLKGQLTGCLFSDILYAQNTLISGFNKDYQDFTIVQDGTTILDVPYVEVETINFSENNYAYILPYQIVLKSYPAQYFIASGVYEPNETWSFEETTNKSLLVKHSISAKAYNNSSGNSNALQNAINWVQARTGISNIIQPILVSTGFAADLLLQSQTENINRFDGIYSIAENYIGDLSRTGQAFLRQTLNMTSGTNGISTVTIAGEVLGGKGLSNLVSEYEQYNPFGAAATYYNAVTSLNNLNPNYLTSGVKQNLDQNRLSFDISFNNDPYKYNVWYDYALSLSSGNGFKRIGIQGQIKARGDLGTRLGLIASYKPQIDLYTLVYNEFEDFFGASGDYLNPTPLTSGYSMDNYNGIATYNATFDSRIIAPSGFETFNYTMNFLPPLQKLSARLVVNGNNSGIDNLSVLDLGLTNRATLSIDGNCRFVSGQTYVSALSGLASNLNGLVAQYAYNESLSLDKKEFITGSNGQNTISFNYLWSFESPNNVINNTGYSIVANLSVN